MSNGEPLRLRVGSMPSSPYSNWMMRLAVLRTEFIPSSETFRSSMALMRRRCM